LTLQDSHVTYTDSLRKSLLLAEVRSSGRPMDGQPEYLMNVNLIYQNEETGLMTGFFYNFKGETYVSGEAAADGLYTPHVVEKPIGSLDYTLGVRFAGNWRLGFDVKNILDTDGRDGLPAAERGFAEQLLPQRAHHWAVARLRVVRTSR
jgi:outer membrane receptor protein involved in Fe transport